MNSKVFSFLIHKNVRFISGALTLAFSFPAVAAEAESTEPVIVITAQRIESALAQLPNNTAVLNADELAQINSTHITEALARIPGSWISRGNGQEQLTAIRSPVFTGPGSCGEFLMMEDGVPLRATGFCNVNQLFDANTEQAARIEVVRGANSALYGSNAIHGVINIISPMPDLNQFGGSYEAGPHGYFRLKRNYQHLGDTQQYLFNFNATHDGGYKDSSGFDQQKFTLRHLSQNSHYQFDTLLSGSHLDQETAGFLQQGPNAYREKQYQKTNEFPEAFRDAQSWRLQSRISQINPAEDFDWHFTPYLRANQMDFLMHFLPGQPMEKNGHQSLGLQWQGNLYFSDSQLTVGLDSEYTSGFLEQFQESPTQSGSAFLDNVLPQGQQYDYEVSAQVIAIYANWQRPLAQDWSLTLAGRFDYLHYDYDNRMLDGNTRDDGTVCGFGGCRYSRPADREDSFDDFSLTASLAKSFDQLGLVYLKLDRAFRAPQAAELYRLQNGQTSSQIDSQQADAIEIGYRYSGENIAWEANLFMLGKDDVIFQNSDRAIVAGAQTSHTGIEVLLRQKLSEQWRWQTNWTYAEHQYANNVDLRGVSAINIDGNEMDTAPNTLGSLQLTWQPEADMTAEIEWLHISDYFTNPENTARYAGHDLINFRMRYFWNENWSGQVRVTNLADTRYAERADFAFGNDRYFVGEPLSIYIGIEGYLTRD